MEDSEQELEDGLRTGRRSGSGWGDRLELTETKI